MACQEQKSACSLVQLAHSGIPDEIVVLTEREVNDNNNDNDNDNDDDNDNNNNNNNKP